MTMKIHPNVTQELCMQLAEERETTLSNPGVCIACGEVVDGCEPDARNYECESCGEKQVFAPEELLISML